MSRPLQLITANTPRPASTRADIRLSVEVDEDSQVSATRLGGRTEVTVSDPQGRVMVTLDLPDVEFRRLITVLSDAWNGASK